MNGTIILWLSWKVTHIINSYESYHRTYAGYACMILIERSDVSCCTPSQQHDNSELSLVRVWHSFSFELHRPRLRSAPAARDGWMPSYRVSIHCRQRQRTSSRIANMSAAAAQMAAGAGDEAEWMMGGDDERLIRSAHSHSGKSLFGSAPSPSGESAAVDWSAQSDAADSASARTAACDWPALVAAAVAEAAHDEQHSLPALSALAAALSALSASTSASTSAAANSSPAAISSTVPAASSVLLSLWPLLPSLYSTLIRPPSSGRRSAVVLRHVVECVLQLSLAFPSSVLLARSELDSAGAAVESESHPCLWSALAAAIDAQCGLSQLSSALLAVSSAGASELFRCCASLLPSTLSVLSVYGDVVGSVLPALYRATDQARTVLFDARSSSLLCQYAAGVVRCVVLTHTPIDVVDGLDPLLPASLSVLSSTSSSPSSSSLSAFPAVSSESALFFPTVSLFDLRLVPDSHPDVDRAHLHSIAVSLVSELAEAVQRCGLLSPSACLHIELLLFVVRQRSVAYVSLCVPIFLRLAGQLSSLPSSCYVSSALHTVRLGLFSLFRLSSCSAYWSAILNVLAQPASSILAMETQRINKQRNQQQQQQQQQAPQQQQQRQQQHSIGAPFGQSTVMPQLSSSDVPLPALREVVDVGSAGLQSLLSSVFSLPLPLICDLILRSLHAAARLVVRTAAAATAAGADTGAGRHQAPALEVRLGWNAHKG